MKLAVRSLVVSAIVVIGVSADAQWHNPDNTITHTNCTVPPCLVGIGTQAPYTHLVVRGTSAVASATAHSDASASIQGSNNVDVAIGTDPGFPFGAWIQVKHNVINQAYPLLLQAAGGDVGIGTRAPYARVQIVGPSSTASTTHNTAAVLAVTGSNNVDVAIGTDPTFPYGAWIQVKHNTIDSAYPLVLQPAGGRVGIGVTNPSAALEVSGEIKGTKIYAHYQDVAEWVPAREDLTPGTVVTLDPEVGNGVQASTTPYDTSVAGVVSAQPGIILGLEGDAKEQVATTGRVRVKVDASRGAIKVGDLLVTSDRPGYAMKSIPVEMGGIAMHRPGTIVGKALEPLAEGQGEVLVLLSLQ